MTHLDWRLLVAAALGAFATLPLAALDDNNTAGVLALAMSLVICPILLVVAATRRGVRALSTFAVLLVYALFKYLTWQVEYDLHMEAKWLEHGQRYRSELASRERPPPGEFRHINWDGWGFVGISTEAFLVYDPDDTLAAAAATGAPGRYAGIPCAVQRVRRLEPHYYTALFYTDSEWTDCDLTVNRSRDHK
jgi:hypothetical protein